MEQLDHRHKTLKEYQKKESIKEFTKKMKQHLTTEMLNNGRIFCLSSSYKNQLMWGHYSSNHTGICLQFNSCDQQKILLPHRPLKIKYQKQAPTLSNINGTYEEFKSILSTKPECWEYEEEYRLYARSPKANFFPQIECDQDNNVQYEQGALTKVILGARFPYQNISRIKEIIRQSDQNIKLSQMLIKDTKYKLTEKNLDL